MRKFLCIALILSNVFGGLPKENENRFLKFEGYVTEKTELNGKEAYLIQRSPDISSYLVIDENTILLDKKHFSIGDKIFALYDGLKPIPVIYPMQYTTVVAGLVKDDYLYRLDYFDEGLVSSDNTLRLNINDTVGVFNLKNEKVSNGFKDGQLFVEYAEQEKGSEITPKRIYIMEYVKSELNIYVKDKKLSSPVLYQDDTPMLPVREICDSLGVEVLWDDDERSVTVSENYKMLIGDRNFYYDNKSFELDNEPFIIENRSYAPIEFFDMIYLKTKVIYNQDNIFIYAA